MGLNKVLQAVAYLGGCPNIYMKKQPQIAA